MRLRQMGDADGVFPGDGVTAVVALNAVVLLVVLVAEKRSALDNAVLAVWKVVSALFSVP